MSDTTNPITRSNTAHDLNLVMARREDSTGTGAAQRQARAHVSSWMNVHLPSSAATSITQISPSSSFHVK